MKTGRISLIVVLLIVLAIPLFSDSALVNPVSEFSAISIINSQEEVIHEAVSAPVYEILAVKPAEIKQTWLPSNGYTMGYFTNTIKSKIQRVNIKATIHRRIRSPV